MTGGRSAAYRAGMPVDVPHGLIVVPARDVAWDDLRAVFESRADGRRCWCQRYTMRPHESWARVGPEALAARLREHTGTDADDAADGRADEPGGGPVGGPCADLGLRDEPRAHDDPPPASGLVAFLDGVPVGWCAVAPRRAYPRLLRSTRVPWHGRDEDRQDPDVWAVTCFLTRATFGRRGVATALAVAAVEHARQQGARAVEGYPMTTSAALPVELHPGTVAMFAAAGMREVAPRSPRRVAMRVDL